MTWLGANVSNVTNLDEQTGVDDCFAKTAMSQFFDLWFTPEFERRRDAGLIPPDFRLQLAQVIFSDKGLVAIRFNSEVRGEIIITADRAVDPTIPVTEDDLRNFRGFDLDPEERDFGHITVFRVGEGWIGSFNALQKRVHVSQMLDRAQRYLEAASDAEIKNHMDVATDTLFSACELISKSVLLLHTQNDEDSKKHKAISSRINTWGKLGNIDKRFVKLFNQLGKSRNDARYNIPDGHSVILPTDAVTIASEQLLNIKELCKSRVELAEEYAATMGV